MAAHDEKGYTWLRKNETTKGNENGKVVKTLVLLAFSLSLFENTI